MMKKFCLGWLLLIHITLFAQTKKDEGFALSSQPDKKQVDVIYNGKLLTSYCYYDSVMKPVLFPVNTISGTTVTRGFPLAPRVNDRADHPHHIGIWLNYENVNGLDFWNTSTARPYNARSRFGTIYHQKIINSKVGKKETILEVSALWKRHDNVSLIEETTNYTFSVSGSDFIIDRTTTLQALVDEVKFKDAKDGLFAIRIARELELPSNEKTPLVMADGKISEPVVSSEGVSGNYLSSEGLKGNAVWSTRAKWVTLTGKINDKPVSITMLDHPKNPGYPAYWHARGYGLFSVNPLGQEVFSKGKEKINLALKKGEEVTFRYRVVIRDGEMNSSDAENLIKSLP